MAQRQDTAFSQRAQLLPTKDTLTALKSDVNLESAILELCDNALDAWKRTSNREGTMNIDISTERAGDTTSLTIRDDAGGVSRTNAAMLFGLGQTAKGDFRGSIGTYGVGAKKSLVNLGVPFRISSRTTNSEEGWTYRITQDWFDDDHDWSVPVDQRQDIEPGVTEIHIEELNYEWTQDTGDLVRKRLGEAYNLFLCDELQRFHETSYDLNIRVNGELVKPEGTPEWSFTPFDGIHPRRFEDIRIESPELDAPVRLHITVGLLTTKDSQNAGTDIYCQKRKVASSLRNEEGGFGTGNERLGHFNARHERLKVILELETDGDGQALPWDTQKSSIDTHNPVMRGTKESRGVYNWVRRAVREYYQLDADKIPTAFVAPFDAKSEFAVNDGKPERLDYTGRQRVVTNHRPETDLPEISAIKQMAAAHAKLQISGSESLEPWQQPAYESQLKQESDRNIENLEAITTLPPDHVVNDPHSAAGRINELARIHMEHGIYHPDELAEWQRPRYHGYMERHGEEISSQQDHVLDDLPLTPDEIDGRPELVANGGELNPGTPAVHTGRTVESDEAMQESAEIFLVFGGQSDEERGARVLDISRQELCRILGLDTDAVDEVIWDQLELRFEKLLERHDPD